MTVNAKHARGFTLLEMAIVLGVVGSVIGSIWVAVSALQTKKATTRVATEIGYIVNRIQSISAINPTALYVAQQTCTGGVNVITGNSLTSSNNAGIFPQEMISGPDNAPVISSPWGVGDVGVVVNATGNICSGGTIAYAGTFALTYLSMPVSACEQILLSKGIGFANMGMAKLCVDASGTNGCTYSATVTPSSAPTQWTEANINYICTLNNTRSRNDRVSVQYTFSTVSP